MTYPQELGARALASFLAGLATSGDSEAWAEGARRLSGLDGRAWLAVDDEARRHRYPSGVPVSGVKGWLSPDVTEPSGFVAAVTSWHADGRFRERATRILRDSSDPLRAAALTVRLFDHVPQVRAAAAAGLVEGLPPEAAETAVAVALAGRHRWYGGPALRTVLDILVGRGAFETVLRALLRSPDTEARRWAYQRAHDDGLLTRDALLAAAVGEPDQLLRTQCARWLAMAACPADLLALLAARPVEARLVALTALADDDLPDIALLDRLTDRSARVRAKARERAVPRGLDVVAWYEQRLAATELAPSVTAHCLEGLAAVAPAGIERFVPFLEHAKPVVRSAAIEAVAQQDGSRSDAIGALVPLMLDASPKVSTTAAHALGRLGAPITHSAAAWNSPQPWSRGAAWLLCRAGGGWDRVEADLRASVDPDADVSNRGTTGIHAWLQCAAARTWAVLSGAQRERIAELLRRSAFNHAVRTAIAFHAGLPQPRAATRLGPSR